eukprot:gene6835-9357_t
MTTFVASQGALNDLSDKFDGRTPVRIHFLDNSSKVFLVNKSTTIKELIEITLKKYGVLDPKSLPYFGLYESRNGSSIDGSIGMEVTVNEVINGWINAKVDQTAKFLFMIRLFMPSLQGLQHRDVVAFLLNKANNILTNQLYLESAEVIDPNLCQLQFMQAIYSVITGKYVVNVDEALELAAIHFLIKFLDYNPNNHRPGFLGNRIVEFIPVKLLKSDPNLNEWEKKLFSKINQIVSDAENNKLPNQNKLIYFARQGQEILPQRKYLDIIYSLPTFGITFFRVSQKQTKIFPENPFLGIYHEGIQVLDKQKNCIRTFHIEEILRWGFKATILFYCEIQPQDELGAILEFETNEGKVISDLLTDYAMSFLKEREEEDLRFEKMKGGKLDISAKPNKSSMKKSNSIDPAVKKGGSAAKNNKSKVGFSKAAISLSRDLAAVRIQSLFRGYSLRNEWAKEDAAILVQSIFRGYQARKKLDLMIEQLYSGDI